MRIELVDPATVPDASVQAWQRCLAASLLVQNPDEPVPPVQSLAEMTRNPGTSRPQRLSLAWDDAGTRVLGGVTTWWMDGENGHVVWVDLQVDPAVRRCGIGRALVAHVVDLAGRDGRRVVAGSGSYDNGAVGFGRAVGAVACLDEYRSRLLLHDRELPPMQEVPGYSPVRWVAQCPDEYAESFTRLKAVMNTAPLGEMDLNDETWDVPRLRSKERTLRGRGQSELIVAARDEQSGELVAYTQVILTDSWPEVGEQGETGVLAEHRGRGLARYVKGDMARWLQREQPSLRLLVTWNATVNAAMLAVNEAIGFRDRELWANLEVRLSG
jgi:GNAT superfamily N-acetyltransferase